ncbi:MAG: NAD(P)/FAD-dependent oxidoreductase [Defluviitoga tunisiensis]
MSQVSLGGINTNEIEPLTLESKIILELFFAGEVIDVAGESGGYNLQWAWSTGYIAGESASSN